MAAAATPRPCAPAVPVGLAVAAVAAGGLRQRTLHHVHVHSSRNQTPSEMVMPLMETLYALHLIQYDAVFKSYFRIALHDGTGCLCR